jgi:WD40 repeat protein
VYIVEPLSGSLLYTLTARPADVNTLAWSPAGHRLAAALSDGTVTMWDFGN